MAHRDVLAMQSEQPISFLVPLAILNTLGPKSYVDPFAGLDELRAKLELGKHHGALYLVTACEL